MPSKVYLLLAILLLLEPIDVMDASVPICIKNCVQCKRMFGPYFQGKACGDACISTRGQFFLDCNNPKTFNTFLKRFF